MRAQCYFADFALYITIGFMSKNLFNLRFGIQLSDAYASTPWRLWITGAGDVYLSTKAMAGIEKYSFHRSGI